MTNFSKSQREESQQANPVTDLTEYGYYVLIDGAFYLIEPYSIQMEFGFNKLGQIKYAPVDETPIRVIVYRPDWHYEHTSFFAQDLDVVNHDYTQRIEPQITQRAEHVFELHFPALTRGQLLVIRDYNNLYCIGMGSVSETLVQLFNTTDAPAYAVVENIKQALKSFPDNLQLQASLGVWELKNIDDKSAKAWKQVEEKWAQYNEREDREGKLLFAGDVEHEIAYYLSLDDQMPQREAAETMLSEIETLRQTKPEEETKEALDKAKLAPNTMVYRAGQFTVTAVEVGEEVLLRFTGLPNEFDGKVLRHQKAIQNESTGAYILQTTEVTGDNWNTFNHENDGWGGLRTFVYPPMIEQQFDVYYDEDLAGESPEQMYEDYCAQLA
ncbi:hypothetical protein BFP72_15190 [Reichenbachiella sp. 5M10]|uniref:hypothetical protein n=1 Tax=Reichenbachiella sp. 5M10 TaxID=1889772 RepID=UPI000C14AA7E|nr:hypothetical protein [Reichenbachiella sp. 5M10]PIB36649.1 hypothetical protein BFP72_15190 [Reichenbachiella sp. 5M10]